jgi:hypothetical protein
VSQTSRSTRQALQGAEKSRPAAAGRGRHSRAPEFPDRLQGSCSLPWHSRERCSHPRRQPEQRNLPSHFPVSRMMAPGAGLRTRGPLPATGRPMRAGSPRTDPSRWDAAMTRPARSPASLCTRNTSAMITTIRPCCFCRMAVCGCSTRSTVWWKRSIPG